MTRNGPSLLSLAAMVALVSAASGDVRLFDDRIDRQEVTEIRYTVPSGRVITGLGFRAHRDNITTMHVRHHRLTADGALVDPHETRLGSEPDHDCEGKVELPEGWVAVGFGAAGEPEWDVTLVRVWARPLNADGTLGEVKEFSDGFKPERGPERYILLEEPDRVLTGAGLRFHSNDIIGVYGCSQRLLCLTPEMKKRIRPIEIRGWVVDGIDEDLAESLAGDIPACEANRVEVRLEDATAAAPALRRLARLGRGTGAFDVYVRLSSAEAAVAERLLADVPELTGVVVDLVGRGGNLQAWNEICEAAGRKLGVRFKRLDAPATDLLRKLPDAVGVLLPPAALAAGAEIPGDRDVCVDIDPAGRAEARSGLPDVRLEDFARALSAAALAGANGYVARVRAGDIYLPDSPNRLGLRALPRLAEDPFQPTDPLWDELCERAYGEAGPEAKVALQLSASACDLTFNVLGVPILTGNGRVLTMGEARDGLEESLDAATSEREASAISRVLAPTDQDVKDAALEKQTSEWLIRQAVANAKAGAEKDPSEATTALEEETRRLQAIAPFWGALARAYLMTQLYEVDTAPRTLGAATGALEDLRNHAESLDAQGVDAFIASASASLETAPERAPLGQALARVERLVADGEHDTAAAAFREVFQTEAFAPHLNKHDERLGKIATSMQALWSPGAMMRSVRGADGAWIIDGVDGRVCWSTSDKAPCIYFDVIPGPLDPPADYLLTFEYYDEGTVRLWINYDSDYPGDSAQRQYRAAEPVQLEDTGTWKTATRELTNSLFSNSQNVLADMRFLADDRKTVRIRDPRLQEKE